MTRIRPLLVALPFVLMALAGCSNIFVPPEKPEGYAKLGFTGSDVTGHNPSGWPRLQGVELTVLDHGAFSGFDDAKKAFENLTGAHVVEVKSEDAGDMLNKAVADKGHPSADVIYGLDNALLYAAVQNDTLEPYKPILAGRIDPSFVFFNASGPWWATPVDHGFVGLNVDHSNPENHNGLKQPILGDVAIHTFTDVADHAGQFVTEDPTKSSPGNGFLLSTIQTFGENPSGQSWQTYWQSLFQGHVFGNCAVTCERTGCVLVTDTWGLAYEQHFSGGYGAPRYGGSGLADRAIVTSYTESPAYEVYFGHGGHPDEVADPIWQPHDSTWHQIQTMGILKGTPHLAAAQAWVEFSLSDAFQKTRASDDAVYPVVSSIPVTNVYGGLDPDPAKIPSAQMDWQTIGENLPRWQREWTSLYEQFGQGSCKS